MKAKISNAKFFCDLIDSFKVLVGQGVLECTGKGLKMEGMDSGNISLNFFELNLNAFEYYSCPEDVNIGVDLNNLSLISKCVEPKDYIILEYSENIDRLNVVIASDDGSGSEKKNIKKQEFEFTLVNLDTDDLELPEMKYNMVINLDTKKFKKMISTFMNVGSVINFKNQDENESESVEIQVVGDFCTLKETLYDSNDKSIQCNGLIDCKFSLKYLNDFAKASGLCSTVKIQISDVIPILIQYDLCNDDQNLMGSIKYYLAPKIDDEND